MADKNWLDEKLFDRMKWLRYVSSINLFAGVGDPLVNPHFPEIASSVRRIAPKSNISTYTNGLALKERNLDAVLENYNLLHVSLNAVKRETYDSIIRGNYDTVMYNLEQLSARRPSSLMVELSLVLVKRNISDVKPMIDFAARLGFQRVIVSHFVPMNWITQEDLFGEEESVKGSETTNEILALEDYARERNIGFVFPQSNSPPERCAEPWTSAYFTTDEAGERTFLVCCSGSYMNLYMNLDSYVHFKKLWNCERMQHIRKTVNGPLAQQNTLCFLCRTVDKTDTKWINQIHRISETRKDITFGAYGPIVFNKIFID